MQNVKPDPLRTHRWRAARRRIAMGNPSERVVLLSRFGDEIRSLTPLAVRASSQEWDLAACLEIASALGVLIGGWLAMDPANPEWPGRDRLYLCRRQDWIAACSVLSLSGFFSPEDIARLVDSLDDEDAPAIPGIELAGKPAIAAAKAAWESAVESARSKRKWKEHFPDPDAQDWASPGWARSGAVWNACLVVDHTDEALPLIRSLAAQGGDKPAGLVVIITIPREESLTAANQWRECGWETLVVAGNDVAELYGCLAAATEDKPLALMLTVSGESDLRSTIGATVRGESRSVLLGDLPDDQFNALMDETLRF